MSADAPPPQRRALRIRRGACSRMPPPPAWCSRFRPEHLRLREVFMCGHAGRFAVSVTRDDVRPLTFVFADDGLVPNNPLPFLVYRQAIDADNDHPEKTIEGLFGANGWGEMWRNGVYDYLHYHATVHEALGVARGHARVRFGGDHGRAFDIAAGYVAIRPAGTGQQCMSASADFCVVGAYPPGPPMDLVRPSKEAHAK